MKSHQGIIMTIDKLVYHSGSANFTKEEFLSHVKPYLPDLKRHNRTNFLCCFVFGEPKQVKVTGYKSDKTINVTNNDNILKCQQNGGKWVVFKTVD